MKERINKLRATLEELNLDAIYLTSRVSHRYFSKFDNQDGALLITKNSAYAFEDFRYTEIAIKLLDGTYTVIQPKGRRSQWLNDVVANEGIKNLGVEDREITLSEYLDLKKALEPHGVAIHEIAGAIQKIRQVKTIDEIEKIKKAQEIADKAFSHILGYLSTNVTENDVAAELEYFMRKNGAEDKSFETISISAEKTSLPHGVPSDEKLKKGFFTMDFGATVDGYHSDMTRTVCIGKADEEMKKLYNTVLEAQLKALEYLSNGGKGCAEADKVARDIINKEYKGYFGHSLGHSVGLEIHESPALTPNVDTILVPGNIVTVEPGIYIPGKYGTRIEDMVLICENGIENFAKSPKELIEI